MNHPLSNQNGQSGLAVATRALNGVPACENNDERGGPYRQRFSSTRHRPRPDQRYGRTFNLKSCSTREHHTSSSDIAPRSIHSSSDIPARQARN
jgi:hypothetical protein